jgi:hypothetical protein
MKMILKLIVFLFLLLGFVFCSINIIRNRSYYNSTRDIFSNVLFLFEDYTEYAPGYSEAEFKKISKGMSKVEVIKHLGEPLSKEIYKTGIYQEYWRFTKGPPDSNYWFRVITFDQNGIVQNVEREYFVD